MNDEIAHLFEEWTGIDFGDPNTWETEARS
jgi:hypothetical protein